MQLDQGAVNQLATNLERARTVATISHRSPDGDTIGAALAWRHALRGLEKTVTSFCIDTIPQKYSFLPEINAFTTSLGDIASYDLIFITDLGDIKLTGLGPEMNASLRASGKIVNVDHHPTNDSYGKYNFVFTHAASATEIVYFLIKALNIRITPQIATALLNGLYTDTGSFMHDNVTPQTLRVASELTRLGADYAAIVKCNFKVKPVSTLKIWGRVLDRLKKNTLGVTSSAVTEEDLLTCAADASELEGVVDFLNSVPGTKFSVLLSERGDVVKGSLRTPRNDIDLTRLAGVLGGGGHRKASGFAVPGKLSREGDEWRVVPHE